MHRYLLHLLQLLTLTRAFDAHPVLEPPRHFRQLQDERLVPLLRKLLSIGRQSELDSLRCHLVV